MWHPGPPFLRVPRSRLCTKCDRFGRIERKNREEIRFTCKKRRRLLQIADETWYWGNLVGESKGNLRDVAVMGKVFACPDAAVTATTYSEQVSSWCSQRIWDFVGVSEKSVMELPAAWQLFLVGKPSWLFTTSSRSEKQGSEVCDFKYAP